MSAIQDMISKSETGLVPTDQDMAVAISKFLQTNMQLILTAGSISLLPYPLYILVKIFIGVRHLIQQKKSGAE